MKFILEIQITDTFADDLKAVAKNIEDMIEEKGSLPFEATLSQGERKVAKIRLVAEN